MITIILTYRNRNLNIVKNCLASLAIQNNKEFQVFLVDYGSQANFKDGLSQLVTNYNFVRLLYCDTEQQLWCKSRAINIALKKTDTPYCFVGDIDMLYHPDFINVLNKEANQTVSTYFQVGFLSKIESNRQKDFSEYKVDFKSQKEATGMTLYNTALLKSINGYDEFYNGWGSEDTDVHLRLLNAGHQVNFYTDNLLLLHQWHVKSYRTKNEVTPLHGSLEQINAAYLDLVVTTKKVKANIENKWGQYNQEGYKKLNTIDERYNITNKSGAITAFINAVLLEKKEKVILLEINLHQEYKSVKQKTKALLGKNPLMFDSMQIINDTVLECIIRNFRNHPYKYQFDRASNTITLIIKL